MWVNESLCCSLEGSWQSRGIGESSSRVSVGPSFLWGVAEARRREAQLLHPAGRRCWYAGGNTPKAAGVKWTPDIILFVLLVIMTEVNMKYLIAGTAAALHRRPGFAEHLVAESWTCGPLGSPSDRGSSPWDPPAGVEALSGSAGWHPCSAKQRSGQTSTDGAEVPASWQLAERHGNQSSAAF